MKISKDILITKHSALKGIFFLAAVTRKALQRRSKSLGEKPLLPWLYSVASVMSNGHTEVILTSACCCWHALLWCFTDRSWVSI